MKNIKQKISKNKLTDTAMKYVFAVSAFFSIIAVVAIFGFILIESFPALRDIGILNFIFGDSWSPSLGQYGLLPMIIGSVCVTIGAIAIGGTIGVFTAVYISRFAGKRVKGILSQLINLLAGIPSIIYGFFGMVSIVPLLKVISPNGTGEGVLACSIILGIMILPTVVSLSRVSLDAVSKSDYDGAVALGSTHAQAVFSVVLPTAKSGIFTSLVLGVGRAIGETMAVMLVAGNAPFAPDGLFGYIRTLTINIVIEMGYAEGLHRQALIATGLVLLIFILLINIIFNYFKSKKPRNKPDKPKVVKRTFKIAVFKKSRTKSNLMKGIAICSTVLAVFALAYISGFILKEGLPHINMNFLFGESGNAQKTLAPAFVTTGYLILISLAIAVPIGICSAIYLVEYAKKGSKAIPIFRTFIETLSGMPSIIFGLFGMIVFCGIFGFGYSILSGALTLSIIILPTIIRATEEALMTVPNSLREGSLALGASKTRTIFKVVLPCALSGIITSVILAIGRIVGESAALIFTLGAAAYMPYSIMEPGASFAVMMWLFASEGQYINQAYATAAVLLIIIFIVNLFAYFVDKKFKKEII